MVVAHSFLLIYSIPFYVYDFYSWYIATVSGLYLLHTVLLGNPLCVYPEFSSELNCMPTKYAYLFGFLDDAILFLNNACTSCQTGGLSLKM